MAIYRRKPLLVDAVQYTSNGNVKDHDVPDWMWEALRQGVLEPADNGIDIIVHLSSKLGAIVTSGDWILKDDRGRITPCSDDLFNQYYELLSNTN